jgi:hypothetical protein
MLIARSLALALRSPTVSRHPLGSQVTLADSMTRLSRLCAGDEDWLSCHGVAAASVDDVGEGKLAHLG